MTETIILIEQELLFAWGEVHITTGAKKTLEDLNIDPAIFFIRHITGDWSELCEEDQQANQQAVKEGSRIFSSYQLPPNNTKLWIITEGDRSVTTFLLPNEY